MSEALRDAYARACIEHKAACDALDRATLRVRTTRKECERLEAALEMTLLTDGIFPQLECAAEPHSYEAAPPRKLKGTG